MSDQEVYIIGSGIIGVACGLHLARRGVVVHFVDHREPGSAASFGNAGSIGSWARLPESSPQVFRKALRWMLQPNGFVKLQPRYLPEMTAWLYHYYRAGRSDRLAKAALALSRLVAYSWQSLWPLVEDTQVNTLVQLSGGLSLYDREADLLSELVSLEAYKAAHGFDFKTESLSDDDLWQIEPDLPRSARFGLLSPEEAAVRDPGALVKQWFEASRATGGDIIHDRVIDFETEGGALSQLRTESGQRIALNGRPVIIAAGAWSHRLVKRLGYQVPLRASRGYHLSFPDPGLSFRRTLLFEDWGFMMNHMTPGLRFAGTVEYDDPDAPPNPRRIENLRRRVFHWFPELAQNDHSTWVGARPSLPDSLPVISSCRHLENAFYAFGHGSLGMTHACGTGALMADLVMGQAPQIDISPYRIDRFQNP